MLTNMGPPTAEENFCDNSNHPVKPHIMEQYNQHIGYVDNSDHMANSYSMIRRTFKWTTKLFFHFLDLTVLNLFDDSTYLQVDHKIIFPLSGPNSTQQLDTVIFVWG